MHYKPRIEANPGEIVGVNVKGMSVRDIGTGAVISLLGPDTSLCVMVFKA